MGRLTKDGRELLRQLHASNGGLLSEEVVLDAARPESSPLHHLFTWDDGEAAERWRLEEARRLIVRVRVHVVQPDNTTIRVREFTSLPRDRHADGGYRKMTDVLASPITREELLDTAARELESFKMKYARLSAIELGPVFDEIDRFVATRRKREEVEEA